MKKQVTAAVLCAAMALTLTACGDPNKKVTASVDYQLDLDELVGELCDYSSVNVAVSDDADSLFSQISTTFGLCHLEEVTDRTVVQDGDYVLADYAGYQDGTAFDGGTATDQYIEVSDDNGYIDGFTDGLPGMEIGETETFDVTFPDDYSETSLAGQTVQFEFTIHGIYQAAEATRDNLTDEDITSNSSAYYNLYNYLGIYTASGLNSYVDYYIESEKQSAVQEYVVDNSEVTCPEKYRDLRVSELIEQKLGDYVDTTDQDAVDEYLTENYGTTYDELVEQIEEQIKIELVFEKIAQNEGIAIDEDEYATYISGIVSSNGYDDETALYEAYGDGDADKGETFLRRMYLINLATEQVMDNATTYVDASAADTED